MRTRLETPYTDTRAGALAWHLGQPAQAALASLTVPVPGGEIELHLLGSSHHVAARVGAGCSEVVACSPGPGGLPGAVRHQLGRLRYRFQSQVDVLDPATLAARARALLSALGPDPTALVGVFPGSPHALTAMVVQSGPGPGRAGWRTWHVYPNSGEVVSTTSLVSW